MTTPTPSPPALTSASATSLRARVLKSLSPSNTPGRYRLLLSATALCCVLFALVGSSGLASRNSAFREADEIAGELIAVQGARAAITQADAVASSSYLVGGQEDPARRVEYTELLADATQRLTVAASTAATDQIPLADPTASGSTSELELLEDASAGIARYAGLIEQARALNRQGLLIGVAYQRAASEARRDVVVPALDQVATSARTRLNDALTRAGRQSWRPLGFGLASLAILLFSLDHVRRRTNRLINVPVAIGAGAVLVALLVTVVSLGSSRDAANTAVEGRLREADAYARARAAVSDARAGEALRLINRGNGQSFENERVQAIAEATQALESIGCDVGCALNGEVSVLGADQAQTAQVEAGGDWDAAVDSMRSSSRFDRVVTLAAAEQATVVEQARAGFDDARSPISGARVLVLIAGLAAAAAAAVGFGQRLREYR